MDTLAALLAAGRLLIGVDEVGRGCLAGPVAAAAYCFHPSEVPPPGLRDSKKLSSRQRQRLLAPLDSAGAFGMGYASPSEIDALNIQRATFLAMRRALDALPISPKQRRHYTVVIDGNVLPEFTRMGWGTVTCLVKADDLVPAVSAASVIAKEARDALMATLAVTYPLFGFEKNSGYGSPFHMAALATHGFCAAHRRSFEPVKSMAPPVPSKWKSLNTDAALWDSMGF